MRLLILSLIFFGLVFAGHGYAELYQYKDSDGAVRMTDDYGSIPDEYKKDVEIQSEIKNNYPQKNQEGEVKSRQDDKKRQNSEDSRAEEDIERLSEKREELADQKKTLQEEYEQIKEERERLSNNAPDGSAPDSERKEYSRKIEKLNDRIEIYQKNAEAFEKKV
ncbi:MAG: hypothetical protein ACOC7W_01805, partial [Desulfosalsimonas sp.]